MQKKEDAIFSGWKEIARYLNVVERTCYNYAKSEGLPIRLHTDGKKSRVFATKNDLDKWIEKRPKYSAHSAFDKKVGIQGRRRPFPKSILLVIAVVLLVSGILLFLLLRNGRGQLNPVGFKIQDSFLIVMDPSGNELWRYDTGNQQLSGEDEYIRHINNKKKISGGGVNHPYIVFDDINHDGFSEVVFSIQSQDDGLNEGEILCFSNRGTVLWRYKVGRRIAFGEKTYSPDFRVGGLALSDLNGDNKKEVIFVAYHYPEFPCQLGILNADGNLLGQYWHSGYILDFALTDLNEDESPEIVIVGLNNEYRKGFFAVLDAVKIQGASPQTRLEYTCRDCSPGSEQCYILFPRTDVDLQMGVVENICQVEVNADKRLLLLTGLSHLYYEFDRTLRLNCISASHDYMRLHQVFSLSGKITSVLDGAYIENIRESIVSWDGMQWKKYQETTK